MSLDTTTCSLGCRLTRITLGAVFASTLLAASAHAQPSQIGDTIARAHFAAANGYFETGDYDSALREFEHAYELTHYPGLLYNLYLCHERLAHLEPAAGRLEAYLATSEDIENRAALEERLANLRRRIASSAQSVAPLRDEPESQPLVEPPPPPPADPAVEPMTETQHRHRSIAPLIAWSVGGAGVVTFATAAILARSEDTRLANSCGRNVDRSCTDAQVAGLRRRTLTADIGLGIGVAGGVLGLVLYLVQDDEDAVRVSASADSHGGLVGIARRF